MTVQKQQPFLKSKKKSYTLFDKRSEKIFKKCLDDTSLVPVQLTFGPKKLAEDNFFGKSY